MPRDYKFDPVTQDLIKDGRGGYVMTETCETSAMNQLRAHYGECPHDPELGSKLHDLDLFKADPANLVPEEARRALSRLESFGRIDSIETAGEQTQSGRVNVRTRFRDRTSGQIVDTHVKSGG